jgi:hypothetical protein
VLSYGHFDSADAVTVALKFEVLKMRRKPYQAARNRRAAIAETSSPIQFRNDEWMTSEQVAEYLQKFRRKDGKPSTGAIHSMVYRGQLRAHKFLGRLLFSRTELDLLIKSSPRTGE